MATLTPEAPRTDSPPIVLRRAGRHPSKSALEAKRKVAGFVASGHWNCVEPTDCTPEAVRRAAIVYARRLGFRVRTAITDGVVYFERV